ncbi:hypothetical protein VTN02DRAFT_4537 [Thermoascus thermophilus]
MLKLDSASRAESRLIRNPSKEEEKGRDASSYFHAGDKLNSYRHASFARAVSLKGVASSQPPTCQGTGPGNRAQLDLHPKPSQLLEPRPNRPFNSVYKSSR